MRRPPRAPLLLGGAALGALVLAAGFLLATQTTDLWQDGAPAGGGVSGVSGDRGALEALEQRLAALETAAPGAPESRLAALEERLEALEGEIAALPAGGDPAALEALRGELLEAARAEVAPLRAGLDETRKSLADLAARVTALPAASAEGDAGEGRAALGSALDELTGRVLALEATAQTLAGKLGALDLLDQRIADQVGAAEARLESRLATALASQEQAAAAPDAATASLALAAAALKDAVVAGRPYASELALLRQLAAGDAAVNAALDPLVASAEQGLPSESALFAAFPATAEAIVAAERAAAGGDWLDDLWASLGGLVTVRPIGEVAGEGAAARVARAERRLAEGDLAAAVTELEGLTGAPAEAAAGWLGGARARLAALEAADALVRQSLARLGAATPPSGG